MAYFMDAGVLCAPAGSMSSSAAFRTSCVEIVSMQKGLPVGAGSHSLKYRCRHGEQGNAWYTILEGVADLGPVIIGSPGP